MVSGRIRWVAVVAALWAMCGPLSGGETQGGSPGPLKRWLLKKIDDRTRQKAAELPVRTIPLRHDGRVRRYLVHEPKKRVGETWPVVFVFHGGGGSAAQVVATCGLLGLSDEKGFLLVAPDGTGPTEESFHTWNVGFGFGEAQKLKVDDVCFFAAVVADMQKRWRIDPRRVFATGISNGGMLCHWLAAQPKTPLAAIAPIVGTVGGRAIGEKAWILPPRPACPVAVLAINGALDEHVPLEGGPQRKSVQEPKEMMSASETIGLWALANGCRPEPEVRWDEAKQTRFFRFAGGRDGTEVVLAVVTNQGHAWPGTGQPGWRGGDPSSPTYDANREMWDFFTAHPKQK